MPYGNPPSWSSSLWWPNACMDPKTSNSKAYEGVEPFRHRNTGVMVFNDGVCEQACGEFDRHCLGLGFVCGLNLKTEASTRANSGDPGKSERRQCAFDGCSFGISNPGTQAHFNGGGESHCVAPYQSESARPVTSS